MKEKMDRKLRITELSKMIGIEASAVRYYEKNGLPTTQRGENGYRYFNEQDAFCLNNLRALCAQGFSIRDALQIMEQPVTPEIVDGLRKNLDSMEFELQLLAARKRWAEESLRLLELREAGDPLIRRITLPDYYFLPASNERNFDVSQKNWKTRSFWTNYLGITRFAGIADGNAYCAGEKVLTDLGQVVSVPDFARYQYPTDPTVRRIHLGDCLCFFTSRNSVPHLDIKNDPQIERYLKEHSLTPTGDLLFFIFFLLQQVPGLSEWFVALPVTTM